MIKKRILNHERIRRIDGGFAFIPHRFLTDGFLSALNPSQQQLYFFLVLAADRHGDPVKHARGPAPVENGHDAPVACIALPVVLQRFE